MEEKKATIIYLEKKVLLSKKLYEGWKECQNDYHHEYKTNMLPMSMEELFVFFSQDWGDDDSKWPFTKKDIYNFYQSNDSVLSTN